MDCRPRSTRTVDMKSITDSRVTASYISPASSSSPSFFRKGNSSVLPDLQNYIKLVRLFMSLVVNTTYIQWANISAEVSFVELTICTLFAEMLKVLYKLAKLEYFVLKLHALLSSAFYVWAVRRMLLSPVNVLTPRSYSKIYGLSHPRKRENLCYKYIHFVERKHEIIKTNIFMIYNSRYMWFTV